MYWPLGAPRIYAATKHRRKPIKAAGGNDEDVDDDDDDEGTQNENPSALLGIRVSRNGHLFATITANALAIWQTFVGGWMQCIGWF